MLRRRSRQYADSPNVEGDRERLKINKRGIGKLSTKAFELTFLAGLHKLDAASKTATFYIMNTTRNRNRWGVTEKALSEASPSLKGKKLGMGAGYKIDKHYPEGECMDCGVFVAYSHQGNYLEGNAKIEDPKTLGMLKDGKLGPISVVIYAYAVSCSKCRAEIEAKPEGAENMPASRKARVTSK